MKDIIEILKKDQEELKYYTYLRLIKNGYDENSIINTDRYVYAEGNIPVLLVAHLDTVHTNEPDTILYDKEQKMLWSPEGIGGDDRCGIYAILKLTEEFKPFVLFTTDEEIGGQGATQFTKDIITLPVNFIIEIDRRGYKQAVFYDCGNEKFKELIKLYGFNEEFGTFSDISIISPQYDIASVNLSAGYYNEHTKTEYISLYDLEYTMDAVAGILKLMTEKDMQEKLKFDYQETVRIPTTYNNYSYYQTGIKDLLFQDFKSLTDEEWLYYYGFERPKKFKQALKKYRELYGYDYDY